MAGMSVTATLMFLIHTRCCGVKRAAPCKVGRGGGGGASQRLLRELYNAPSPIEARAHLSVVSKAIKRVDHGAGEKLDKKRVDDNLHDDDDKRLRHYAGVVDGRNGHTRNFPGTR